MLKSSVNEEEEDGSNSGRSPMGRNPAKSAGLARTVRNSTTDKLPRFSNRRNKDGELKRKTTLHIPSAIPEAVQAPSNSLGNLDGSIVTV